MPTTGPMVMTKRTLYAQLAVLFVALACPPGARSQPASSSVPCGSCLTITILAGQQLLLPDDLAGVTVLVRIPIGASPVGREEALAEISRRGGRAGVLVEAPVPASVPPDLIYRLKSFLTALRGELREGTVLALESAGPVRSLLVELVPYVDAIVGGEGSIAGGVRLWPRLAPAAVPDLLRATQRGGFEQWVVTAPEDALAARALIHGIAAAAARPREGLFEDVEVRGARTLQVAEIIARHQAAMKKQRDAIATTIATGEMTLTFEAPGFPAPVTVAAHTTIYADRDRTELAQREIRVNGIVFKDGGVPRLPILEPERVSAPPMAITLTNLYRYRLDGEERVDGVPCYVVAFDPVDASQPLFRGRAWIAKEGFAMVKVAAAQTGLRGAIVSSEQVDVFREVRPGLWLLARSNVRQIYEGASHRTPIHRLLTIETHEIDPADFVARRQSAYASDALLLRDTPAGYRYLRRVPAEGGAAREVPEVEVAGAATRVRTLAAGVIIDPNISRPLPFAGLSYVDFDLFGTGAQLSGFFGGAYGQLSFSAPSLGGTRWQLGGRAFGIASSYNDRAFRGGREVYDENLRQRPAHAAVWVMRPLSPRLSVRAGYALDYTRLRAAPETATGFAVPADQVVHNLQLAIEGQRAGWTGSLWFNPARRTGWRPWGRGEDYDESARDFARYGVTLARSTSLSPRVTTRLEAQWMAGHDLDRFSRYAFGSFDNRLRGYPSALVRYDRGGVLRAALAWSAARFVRLDAFADTAAVRDPGYGRGFRNYTGIGLAAEIPVPFGVLAAAEWGYGLRGVNADGALGTHVIRISAFKVF